MMKLVPESKTVKAVIALWGIKEPATQGMCIARSCTNKSHHRRSVCNSCYSAIRKHLDPAWYALKKLKHGARRRRIACSLTIAEWRRFCTDTGYLERKGKRAGDLTIDRINPKLGYSIENIRAVTNSENVIKGNKERRSRFVGGRRISICAIEHNESQPTEDDIVDRI